MDRSNTEYVDNSGDDTDVARWLMPHRYADELADTKPRTLRLRSARQGRDRL